VACSPAAQQQQRTGISLAISDTHTAMRPPDEGFCMQCGPGAALQPDRPAHHDGAARYRVVAMSLRTARLEAARLERLVRASEWFVGVLDAARACGAPDC